MMSELEPIALLQLQSLLLTNKAENRASKEAVKDMLLRIISGEYPLTYLVAIEAIVDTDPGAGEFQQPTLRAAVIAAEKTFFFEGRHPRDFKWMAYMMVTFPTGKEISIPISAEYTSEVFAFDDT